MVDAGVEECDRSQSHRYNHNLRLESSVIGMKFLHDFSHVRAARRRYHPGARAELRQRAICSDSSPHIFDDHRRATKTHRDTEDRQPHQFIMLLGRHHHTWTTECSIQDVRALDSAACLREPEQVGWLAV